MNNIHEFDRLLNAAESSATEHLSVEEYEPQFIALLKGIKASPELRSEIASRFIERLRVGQDIPYDVFSFCMHELCWAEVLESAKAFRLTAGSQRIKDGLDKVIESFAKTWPEANLYAYYRAAPTKSSQSK